MVDATGIDLFLGLDLGKEFHHTRGLTCEDRTVHDKRLPNTEPKLLELFTKLVTKFGTVLVIVDQVANIGALPLTVARAAACRVAYLPGLSVRRAADLHPGEAKTDARDAYVIAQTARSMPHTLRAVDRDDEALAELTMLTGYDSDLASEVNRTTNRPRGLLSHAAAHTQRRQAGQKIAALLEALPLFHLLTSLPGLGVRTTAAVIVAIGDGISFPTAGHLASYAGLAPATKSSGTSIRGEHAPHRGNRLLKRALFQAAFAAIDCTSDPSSRIYYDRQSARGKTHTQAILRLARQRVNVIHAMIRTGALYEPRTPDDVDLAA